MKTIMNYYIRAFHIAMTGELTKRAIAIANGTVTLDQFCALLAQDNGVLAGKESYIKGVILSIFDKIHEILMEGKIVNLDNLIRLTPTIRGEVDPDTGRPNANTTLGVAVCALKDMKLSIEDFTLECRDGTASEPVFLLIYAPGVTAAGRDKIYRNQVSQISGRNIYCDAAQGDTLTATYTLEGLERSVVLEPTEVSPYGMRFAFPEAFASLADGTEIEITLRTHMGVEESPFSVASRKVVLVSK